MKLLFRLLGAIFALFVAALVALSIYFDVVVGNAIERGGTYALGVETKVGAALARPISGSLDIRRLRVANPPGFDADHFLKVRSGRFHVRLKSLLEQTVRVPLLALDGVEVALENNQGQTNTNPILQNLSRFEKGGEQPPPDAKPADKKRYIVEQLVITDITAEVDIVDPLAGVAKLENMIIEIPEIRMQNIGAHDEQGVVMSELSNIVVKAVLTAVAKNGTQLPGVILGQLTGGLGTVSQVPVEIVAVTLETSLEATVGKGVAEPVGRFTRGAGKMLGDQAGRAMKGLFGGSQDEE